VAEERTIASACLYKLLPSKREFPIHRRQSGSDPPERFRIKHLPVRSHLYSIAPYALQLFSSIKFDYTGNVLGSAWIVEASFSKNDFCSNDAGTFCMKKKFGNRLHCNISSIHHSPPCWTALSYSALCSIALWSESPSTACKNISSKPKMNLKMFESANQELKEKFF
jgi:hypothetical protein